MAFITPLPLLSRHATRSLRPSLTRPSLTRPSLRPSLRHAAPRRHASLLPRRAPIIAQATQQDTSWNTCSVVVNDLICEDHHMIVVNVGTTGSVGSLCDTYRVPGMFVKMRIGENESFFAISNAPNIMGVFEFLVKKTEGNEWICAVQSGDVVELSPVMGKGFPIAKLDLLQFPGVAEEKKALDIYLFATGSGIAPIRAAIESLLNGISPRQRRSVTLFYGARYSARMPYMDRFSLWEEDGVTVIPVLSQGEEGWQGKRGYIQNILQERGVDNPAQSGVLLCGVKGMATDVKQLMTDYGVDPDRILTNF